MFVLQDVRLKVSILELMTVCVESQPGFLEMFLDLKQVRLQRASLLQSGSDGKTGDAAAKSAKADSSCLQIVLELIQQEKQVQDVLRLYPFAHICTYL